MWRNSIRTAPPLLFGERPTYSPESLGGAADDDYFLARNGFISFFGSSNRHHQNRLTTTEDSSPDTNTYYTTQKKKKKKKKKKKTNSCRLQPSDEDLPSRSVTLEVDGWGGENKDGASSTTSSNGRRRSSNSRAKRESRRRSRRPGGGTRPCWTTNCERMDETDAATIVQVEDEDSILTPTHHHHHRKSRVITETVYFKLFHLYVTWLRRSRPFRVALYKFYRIFILLVLVGEAVSMLRTTRLFYQFGVGFATTLTLWHFVRSALATERPTTRYLVDIVRFWGDTTGLTAAQFGACRREILINSAQLVVFSVMSAAMAALMLLPTFGDRYAMYYTLERLSAQPFHSSSCYWRAYCAAFFVGLLLANAIGVGTVITIVAHVGHVRQMLALAGGHLVCGEQRFDGADQDLLRNADYQRHVHTNLRNAAILHSRALQFNIRFNRIWGWLTPAALSTLALGILFTVNTFMHYNFIKHTGVYYLLPLSLECNVAIFLVEFNGQRLLDQSESFHRALLESVQWERWNVANRNFYRTLLLGNTQQLFYYKFKTNLYFSHIGLTKYVKLVYTICSLLKVIQTSEGFFF